MLGAYVANVIASVAFADLPVPVLIVVITAASAAALVALVAVSRRLLGAPRGLIEYGLAVDGRWVRDLVVGSVLGLTAAAAPMALAVSTGAAEVQATLDRGALRLVPGILLVVLGCYLTGFWEELALRGVFLCNAADGLRTWLTPGGAVAGAVALNALVFGVAHIAQVTVPALVTTWVLSGLVLSALYVLSGDLALVIGAHAAYNLSHQVLFVRSDIPGVEELSVLARVSTDPADLWLAHGGLIEAGGFLLLGVLGVLWLRASGGRLRLRVRPLEPTPADATTPDPRA